MERGEGHEVHSGYMKLVLDADIRKFEMCNFYLYITFMKKKTGFIVNN